MIALGKVIKKLGNEYGRSQDIDLNKFEDRYDDIAKEVKIVSHLVEDNLGAYNKVILKSGVILQDDWLQCIVCAAALYAAIGGSCALVTACSWGFGIQICSWILAYGLSDYGVDYVCDLLYDCDSLSEPPYEYIGSSLQSLLEFSCSIFWFIACSNDWSNTSLSVWQKKTIQNTSL